MLKTEVHEGKNIVVATVLGREFRFINRCSHRNCDVSKGHLEGSTLVCVCGWQYDLLTGKALNHPLASLEKA